MKKNQGLITLIIAGVLMVNLLGKVNS